MTSVIYNNCYTCWNSRPANASDECGSLGSSLTYANGVGLASNTPIENINIVIPRGKVKTPV
jgi:hypothetical protein